jgi:hypothetical protein
LPFGLYFKSLAFGRSNLTVLALGIIARLLGG